jgi:hypothetical protein
MPIEPSGPLLDDEPRDSKHNRPPADLTTGEVLREQLRDEFATLLERRDELVAAELRVPDVNDEDTARKVSDFIKQIQAVIKAADAARVARKEPYLEGCRGIDGFFKAIAEPMEKTKRKVEALLTDFLRRKADKERREREERERQARMDEERRRREAETAAANMRDEASLHDALERERVAEQAAADRRKAEKEADAKPADMSRTRGDFGAVSSLRTTWTFSNLDRATLDLEKLREHLPMDGLERAVRSFVKSGGRELYGVRIFESTDAVVR